MVYFRPRLTTAQNQHRKREQDEVLERTSSVIFGCAIRELLGLEQLVDELGICGEFSVMWAMFAANCPTKGSPKGVRPPQLAPGTEVVWSWLRFACQRARHKPASRSNGSTRKTMCISKRDWSYPKVGDPMDDELSVGSWTSGKQAASRSSWWDLIRSDSGGASFESEAAMLLARVGSRPLI